VFFHDIYEEENMMNESEIIEGKNEWTDERKGECKE